MNLGRQRKRERKREIFCGGVRKVSGKLKK